MTKKSFSVGLICSAIRLLARYSEDSGRSARADSSWGKGDRRRSCDFG
jgi:hypothetical protein